MLCEEREGGGATQISLVYFLFFIAAPAIVIPFQVWGVSGTVGYSLRGSEGYFLFYPSQNTHQSVGMEAAIFFLLPPADYSISAFRRFGVGGAIKYRESARERGG